MNISILNREFKKKKLELSNLDFCYLLAIRNENPIIWKQLKDFINSVENYTKEVE